MNDLPHSDLDQMSDREISPVNTEVFAFGPFRLDGSQGQLYRDNQPLALSPKAFAVLAWLLKSQGSLVTKDQLLSTVWAGTIVSDAALTVCIREIRKALGDSARSAQYIGTVHKRGYRFIGEVKSIFAEGSNNIQDHPHSNKTIMVGREVELSALDNALSRASQGDRQLVFITGEAGIGKTTLAEISRERFTQMSNIIVMRGQCLEHHGRVEPYQPWLDALSRICRQDSEILALFKQYSPMWLLHTPWLLSDDEYSEHEKKRVASDSRQMMREMLEVLQALSAQRLLVIYLDDLHFSDDASVELLAYISRYQGFARLLIVGCYRPVDLKINNHPLKSIKLELEARRLCTELPLELFSKTLIGRYIDKMLPNNDFPCSFVKVLHSRADGNPLFAANIIEYLIKRQWLLAADGHWKLVCDVDAITDCVPEKLIEMLGYHIEQLEPDIQTVLEVAAVSSDVSTGDVQFSTAEVGAALEKDAVVIEQVCDRLAHNGHFLASTNSGQLPDNTILRCYKFTHGLYQKAFYERIVPGDRSRFHHLIGDFLEKVYGRRNNEIALKLAVHFEQGRDYMQAAKYLKKSAETASLRGVNNDAINYINHSLKLLLLLGETTERTQLQVELYITLATIYIADKGNSAPEVEQCYLKARKLCSVIGSDVRKMFPISFGLRQCRLLSGQLQQAHKLGEELLDLAQTVNDKDLLVEAHTALSTTAQFLGNSTDVLAHAQAAIKIYSIDRHVFHVIQYGMDPGVYCHGRAAQALWILGHPDQALSMGEKTLELAQKLEHPYTLAFALNKSALIHLHRNESEAAEKVAIQAVNFAREHGFLFNCAWAKVQHGWALVAQGKIKTGLKVMHGGLNSPISISNSVRSYLFTLFADACLKAGYYHDGLAALDKIVDGAEYFFQAKRYQLRGEFLILKAGKDENINNEVKEAEDCFHKALKLAMQQKAFSFELIAATSLARYWYRQNRIEQARDLLTPIISRSSEGHALQDYVDARNLADRCGENIRSDKIIDLKDFKKKTKKTASQ